MSNTIKKVAWALLAFLVIANLLIWITGNTHLYKGIANTYLKCRTGPDIDEFPIFSNRTVAAGEHQPLPNAADYNSKAIDTKAIEDYGTVAYLVIRNDSVRYEHYWDGYGPDSLSNSFSMAKGKMPVLE